MATAPIRIVIPASFGVPYSGDRRRGKPLGPEATRVLAYIRKTGAVQQPAVRKACKLGSDRCNLVLRLLVSRGDLERDGVYRHFVYRVAK